MGYLPIPFINSLEINVDILSQICYFALSDIKLNCNLDMKFGSNEDLFVLSCLALLFSKMCQTMLVRLPSSFWVLETGMSPNKI